MAKITLGKPPESFARTIDFMQVDGAPGSMNVTFIYRTRKEYGEFADGVVAEMETESAAEIDKVRALAAAKEPIPPLTQSDVIARELARDTKYVVKCIKGWNLDVPMTKETIAQLADEVPAAITAIAKVYRDAILEGQAGN